MDHFGPWIVVAVIAIGWGARALRGFRRFAADLQAATADPTARTRAAELARGRAAGGPGRPSTGAPAAPLPGPRPVASVPANARTTSPTRRVPLGGARPGVPLADPFEPTSSAGGRALAEVLRTGTGLRTAVVLAEVLAPPVALR
jgi:hypothetical protein